MCVFGITMLGLPSVLIRWFDSYLGSLFHQIFTCIIPRLLNNSVYSDTGFGTLTCPNAQPTDQGAYSCEAINIKGSVFVVPDTILTVLVTDGGVCPAGQYNTAATTIRECVSCFCFGATSDCYSTDGYISQVLYLVLSRFSETFSAVYWIFSRYLTTQTMPITENLLMGGK